MSENIICFAKDWFEDPTSNHHVMEHVAKHHRVLWLNSISTRTPNLTSGRDVKKIFRKLKSFADGPQKVGDNLWVYTPLVLPLPHQAWATKLNQQILRETLKLLRVRLGMDDFQLWTFLPNVGDYVGTLGESSVVYYCVDEWSQFSYIDTDKTVAAEKKLCERADVIFAVCHELAERKRKLNPSTFLSTHGVDHEVFSKALDDDTRIPADVADLPKPLLGFYGTIQDWVDLDLVAQLAERHPEWSIVLIGTAHVDTSKVERFSNVHLLGRKPHSELPAYCKAFDVGLIPYVITERMKYVNPIKLREYLCAGLPVVSTAVPEVRHYGEYCTVADDFDAFEVGVVRALGEDTAERAQQRSDAMRQETWERKVQAVLQRVHEAKTPPLSDSVPVLVTGANGGLGSAVVQALLARGERVRIFVRRHEGPVPDGIEVALGDLGDPDAVDRAVKGARRVVHAGAVMKGSWEQHHRGTVLGTKHVLESCARHGVHKLVYISSMSVINFAGADAGANVDEDTIYEQRAEERGFYTQAKLEAEKIVREWVGREKLPTVILRPGQIFGGRIPLLTGAVARRAGGGRWLMLGDGGVRLPLVYLDDVVDGILKALDSDLHEGEVIQLVDPESLTQNDVIARARPHDKVIRTPRSVLFAAGRASEPVLGLLEKKSPVSEYRLQSAMADRRFDSVRAKDLLGWRPRVGVSEGIRRMFARESS